jgi:hypothetical protein
MDRFRRPKPLAVEALELSTMLAGSPPKKTAFRPGDPSA